MGARFDDGKEEGALRTIGEVSRALGIPTHILRYWEQQFPMLRPLKRSGGRRYYRRDDVVLIERIARLVNEEGYTLKGASALLASDARPSAGTGSPGVGSSAARHESSTTNESGTGESEAGASAVAAVDTAVIARLKNLRSDLAAALEQETA